MGSAGGDLNNKVALRRVSIPIFMFGGARLEGEPYWQRGSPNLPSRTKESRAMQRSRRLLVAEISLLLIVHPQVFTHGADATWRGAGGQREDLVVAP